MTQAEQKEETTSKRDQLIAVIANYKQQYQDYNTFAAFLYIKQLTSYSDDNCILILEQCSQRGINPFDLTAIKGFASWRAERRLVRKGEKCFYILAPIMKRGRDPETGEEAEQILGFKCAFVFDISQTDEIPSTEQASTAQKKKERASGNKRSRRTSSGTSQPNNEERKTEDEAQRRAEADAQHQREERDRQEQARRQREQQRSGPMTESEARILLGLGLSAFTAATLKKAYRAAALKYHPDHGGSVDMMKRVNAAHDVLKAYAR
jgi:DnaJ homolog subfamily C member 19